MASTQGCGKQTLLNVPDPSLVTQAQEATHTRTHQLWSSPTPGTVHDNNQRQPKKDGDTQPDTLARMACQALLLTQLKLPDSLGSLTF